MTQLSTLFKAGAGEKCELFHVQDQKSPGTQGGSLTLGSWQTRVLNTVLKNEISGASLASNQLTLPAGDYEVTAKAVAYTVNRNKLRIWNTTDASLIAESINEEITSSVSGMDTTVAFASFSLSSSKVIELQHRSETTHANGLGFQINSAFAVNKEIYCDVQIRRRVSSITLPFQAPLFHVRDEKTSGTYGGVATAGSWQTRVLNTEVTNEIDGASLASNQITLPVGKYYIIGRHPMGYVNYFRARIYNADDATEVLLGEVAYSHLSSDNQAIFSEVFGNFTLNASKKIELNYYCSASAGNSQTLGTAISIPSTNEIYGSVRVWKLN